MGAEGIAEHKHIKGYLQIKDVQIAAICDSNQSAAEDVVRKYEISGVYSDCVEMLEKENLDL